MRVFIADSGRAKDFRLKCVRLTDTVKNRLYVGNLAEDVSTAALQELFEPHGFVMDVKLMTVGKAAEAVRVAFVILATDESAEAAVKALNGSFVHGVAIRVEVAREEGGGARRSTEGVV